MTVRLRDEGSEVYLDGVQLRAGELDAWLGRGAGRLPGVARTQESIEQARKK